MRREGFGIVAARVLAKKKTDLDTSTAALTNECHSAVHVDQLIWTRASLRSIEPDLYAQLSLQRSPECIRELRISIRHNLSRQAT